MVALRYATMNKKLLFGWNLGAYLIQMKDKCPLKNNKILGTQMLDCEDQKWLVIRSLVLVLILVLVRGFESLFLSVIITCG